MEICSVCGEKKVVFVVANKWRCKACGKYFDWTEIKRAKDALKEKKASGGAAAGSPPGAPP
ncbi:MAG TPA: hypothetical protein VM681_08435 [Candidatus Thermoplasmatota archaeon]|nr:hypothetical protein [Candidatus Thermoplasmatota archaeon]